MLAPTVIRSLYGKCTDYLFLQGFTQEVRKLGDLNLTCVLVTTQNLCASRITFWMLKSRNLGYKLHNGMSALEPEVVKRMLVLPMCARITYQLLNRIAGCVTESLRLLLEGGTNWKGPSSIVKTIFYCCNIYSVLFYSPVRLNMFFPFTPSLPPPLRTIFRTRRWLYSWRSPDADRRDIPPIPVLHVYLLLRLTYLWPDCLPYPGLRESSQGSWRMLPSLCW